MRSIKLMADYQCHPLWNMSEGEYGDINPADLPISNELQMRLAKWARMYDETLNMDYPPNSGFKTEELESDFKREGISLAESLRSELGPEFNVTVQL